jgi:hypothetical protein
VHRQAELTQDALDKTGFQLAAAGRNVAHQAITFNPNMTALAALWNHVHNQTAQFAKQFAAGHVGKYTFMYINPVPNFRCVQ